MLVILTVIKTRLRHNYSKDTHHSFRERTLSNQYPMLVLSLSKSYYNMLPSCILKIESSHQNRIQFWPDIYSTKKGGYNPLVFTLVSRVGTGDQWCGPYHLIPHPHLRILSILRSDISDRHHSYIFNTNIPAFWDHLQFKITVNPVFEAAAFITGRLLQKQRLWERVCVAYNTIKSRFFSLLTCMQLPFYMR